MPTRASIVSRKVGKAGLMGTRPAYSQAPITMTSEAARRKSGWLSTRETRLWESAAAAAGRAPPEEESGPACWAGRAAAVACRFAARAGEEWDDRNKRLA